MSSTHFLEVWSTSNDEPAITLISSSFYYFQRLPGIFKLILRVNSWREPINYLSIPTLVYLFEVKGNWIVTYAVGDGARFVEMEKEAGMRDGYL
jgi:hypothetical protein